jgi:hypothetical protein
MKKFIKRLFIYLIPIVVLSYPLDLLLSKYLKKSNDLYGEFEVWNDIYENNINASLLIYGSSRAWVGINPHILKNSLQLNSYNFGMDGHNFWLQYLRHLEYLKFNKAPKQIVVAVEFSSLQKRNDLYLYEQFLPYLLWNKNMIEYTKSYEGFDFFDYYIPLIRYFGNSSSIKKAIKIQFNKDSITTFRTLGYRGIKKEWSNELEEAKSKMDHYTIQLDSTSVKLFDQFLMECKENNIKVTLVYTPEHIEGQQFLKNKEEVIELYKSFAKKYNLQFLDYSIDPICRDRQYFYNSTHLNKKGSVLFTKKLASELKQNQLIK